MRKNRSPARSSYEESSSFILQKMHAALQGFWRVFALLLLISSSVSLRSPWKRAPQQTHSETDGKAPARPVYPQRTYIEAVTGCAVQAGYYCPPSFLNGTALTKVWMEFSTDETSIVEIRQDDIWTTELGPTFPIVYDQKYLFPIDKGHPYNWMMKTYTLANGGTTMDCLMWVLPYANFGTRYLQDATYTGVVEFMGSQCYEFESVFNLTNYEGYSMGSLLTYVNINTGQFQGWFAPFSGFFYNYYRVEAVPKFSPQIWTEPQVGSCRTIFNDTTVNHRFVPSFVPPIIQH